MTMMPMRGAGAPMGGLESKGRTPSMPVQSQGIPQGMPFGGNPQMAAMQSAMQGKSGGTPQPPQRGTIQPVMDRRNALLSALQQRRG
jgi:hypothetical protein